MSRSSQFALLILIFFSGQTLADITTGLVAHYAFENNLDDSQGSNNSLASSAITYASGQVGSAAVFNGSSSYTEVTRMVQNDFSIGFWIKTTSTGADPSAWAGIGIVTADEAGYVDDYAVSIVSNGKLGFGVGDTGGYVTATSLTSINDNSWHHIVVTRSQSSGEMNVYVDNVLEATQTGTTAILDDKATIQIGAMNLTPSNFLNGSLDHIKIYSRVLTSTDVTELYNDLSASNSAPVIAGVTASTTINDNATATPFSSVTITDLDNDNVTVSVSLDTAAKGAFSSASLTASGFTDAGGGSYTLSSTAPVNAQTAIRQLVFAPTENRVTPTLTEDTTFTITVNDGTATNTDSTTVVTSTSVNDAPSITIANSLTTSENTAQVLSFSYTDVDGDTVTATEQTAPTNGSISISGTNITYTPVSYYNGSDSFVVTLSDGSGYSTNHAVSVTVNSVNQDPVITIANSLSTDEDTPAVLSFSYSDVDGDTVTATQQTAPTNGSLSISGTNITYTPAPNYNGSDSFVVTLSDGSGYTNNHSVAVSVNAVNDDPSVSIANSLTTSENTAQVLSFSYTDADGDTVTATEQTAPTNGSISISGTNITYTPNANYNGSDSFVVTLSDGNGYGTNHAVSVTVTSVNQDPVITIANSLSTDEDTPAVLSFSYSDVDGDTVTATQQTAPTNGSLSISGTNITYTPAPNYNGSDSFVVTLSDGSGYTNNHSVTVTVNAVNDDPSVSIANSLTTSENTAQVLSFSYTDADGDTVTATEQTAPTNGSISISGTNITYTPNANYNGSDSFVVTLSDGNGYSTNHAVSVTVTSVNQDPVITIANSLSTNEDTPAVLSFSYTDVDGDTVTATQQTAPTNGSLSISGTNITYTPAPNYNGSDSFVVTLSDGSGYTNNHSVAVSVNAVNDAPIITLASTLNVAEDTTGALNIIVDDVEGETVSVNLKTPPTNGNVEVTLSTLSYTPNINYFGTDSFTLVFSDGSLEVERTVSVNVSAVNDAPVVTIAQSIETDRNKSFFLDYSVTDDENDEVSLSVKVQAENGSAILQQSISNVLYMPNRDFSGQDSFTLTFTDSQGAAVDKQINVTVNAIIKDPQITITRSLRVFEDEVLTIPYTIEDGVAGPAYLEVTSEPTFGGTLEITDSEVIYTPEKDVSREYVEFTLSLKDSGGYSLDLGFIVYIRPVNDAPVAFRDEYTLDQNAVLNVDADNGVLANDSDPDQYDQLNVQVRTRPAYAKAFSLNPDGSFSYQHNGTKVLRDSFEYIVTDRDGTSDRARVVLNLNQINSAPYFYTSGRFRTKQGYKFGKYIDVRDDDRDNLSLSIKSAPEWLSLSQDNYLFSQQVPYSVLKDSYPVVLELTDGKDTVENTYYINVDDIDSPIINITAGWDKEAPLSNQPLEYRANIENVGGISEGFTGWVGFTVENAEITAVDSGCVRYSVKYAYCRFTLAIEESQQYPLTLQPIIDGDVSVRAQIVDTRVNKSKSQTDSIYVSLAPIKHRGSFNIENATVMRMLDSRVGRSGYDYIVGTKAGIYTHQVYLESVTDQEGLLVGNLDNNGETKYILATDINGDGLKDAVLINERGGQASAYYLNKANNRFQKGGDLGYPIGGSARFDFNGDGQIDISIFGRNRLVLFRHENNKLIATLSFNFGKMLGEPIATVSTTYHRRRDRYYFMVSGVYGNRILISYRSALLRSYFNYYASNASSASKSISSRALFSTPPVALTTAQAEDLIPEFELNVDELVASGDMQELELPVDNAINTISADLNNDGVEELIVISGTLEEPEFASEEIQDTEEGLTPEEAATTGDTSIDRSVTILAINDDSGEFETLTTIGNSAAHSVYVEDLNGDGYVDLLIGLESGVYETYLGEGNAVDFIRQDQTIIESSRNINIQDLDGDGNLEIMALDQNTGEVRTYPSKNGSFATTSELSIASEQSRLTLDVQGDSQTIDFVIRNAGPLMAENLMLTMKVPEFVEVSISNGTCANDNNETVCSLGSLDINQSITVTASVIALADSDWQSLSVSVASDNDEQDETDNAHSIDVMAKINKTSSGGAFVQLLVLLGFLNLFAKRRFTKASKMR
ncbi:tandem-95 repeat protein [Thalassotalea ganghwensis]